MELSSPEIERAYELVRSTSSNINWITLRLKSNSNESLELEATGEGIDALQSSLNGEIQFGLLNVENQLLLFAMIPSSIRGAKRAKLLVNIRQLYSVFRAQATLTFSSPSEFILSTARQKLLLDQPDLPLQASSTYSSPGIPSPTSSPPISEPEIQIQSPETVPPELPFKPSHTLSELGQRISMAPNSPDLSRYNATLRQSSATMTYLPDDISPDDYNSPTITSLSRNPSVQSTKSERLCHLDTTNSSTNTSRTPSRDRKRIVRIPVPKVLPPGISPELPQKSDFSLRNGRGKKATISDHENQYKELPSPVPQDLESFHPDTAIFQEKALPTLKSKVVDSEIEENLLALAEEIEKKERKRRELSAWKVIDQARSNAELERSRKEEEEKEETLASKEFFLDAAKSLPIDSLDLCQTSLLFGSTSSKEKKDLIPLETEEGVEKEEREWFETQERSREACEVMDLLFEQQKLAKRLKEIEELQLKEEQRKNQMLISRRRFELLRRSGEVMLSGWISIKKKDTIMYRRRRYEIRGDKLSLFRSEFELASAIDTILTRSITALEHQFDPEDSAIRHSFKLISKEEDWSLFTDEKEEKELFIIAMELAIRSSPSK